jgi:protein ImuB
VGKSFAELIECLRSRFGSEAVYGLCLVPEHRPESAWMKTDGESGSAKPAPRVAVDRPLWMLAEPVPLVVTPAGPCYDGVLSLEQGPERIETGWWDGRDVARDYFQARNPTGMNLWVYRQRRGQRGWYLHGIFG